jgi:hypothetical protein
MTLLDYLHCTRDVAAATAKLKKALTSAESPEELELLVSRLKKVCDAFVQGNVQGCGSARDQGSDEPGGVR